LLDIAAMSELSFARQFLSALDTRPIKLSSDHVADPHSYPAQGAVCAILNGIFEHVANIVHTVHTPEATKSTRKTEAGTRSNCARS
jgi:hypothetical protein